MSTRNPRSKKDQLYQLSTLVSRLTGVPLPVNKAIVGEMAFTHEEWHSCPRGHTEPSTYESIKPEMVGRKRRIVLASIPVQLPLKAALAEMNYRAMEPGEEIVKRIKQLGDEGKTGHGCRPNGGG